MSARTTESVIHFSAPFILGGFSSPQPAGNYRLSYDEVQIEGLSFVAYRKVATFINLPAIGVASGTSQLIAVDATELEAALQQDQQQLLQHRG